jgi:hypothetical protein
MNDHLLDPRLCERLLAAALSRGGHAADVYAQRASTRSMSFEEGKVKSASHDQRLGVGIRNHHGVTRVTRRLGDVDGLLPAGNDQQRFAHDRTLTGAWKPGGFRAC